MVSNAQETGTTVGFTDSVIRHIGVGIGFSPRTKALIAEVLRIRREFGSKLFLIHAGGHSDDKETEINEILDSLSANRSFIEIVWRTGNNYSVIRNIVQELNIDLLIAGAVKEETGLKYFTGSLTRRLLRNPCCNMLVLTDISETPTAVETIVVNLSDSKTSEKLLQFTQFIANHFANKDIHLVNECHLPGLYFSVSDSGSEEQSQDIKKQIKEEAEERMKAELSDLQLSNERIYYHCLFGKEGWEALKLTNEVHADLYVAPAPKQKLNIMDRLFQHDLEYLLMHMPCNLLLVKE